jgi:hypothetical protein
VWTLTWSDSPFSLISCALDYNITTCVHRYETCDCKKCKGKGKGQWYHDQIFLDSGVSQYFINDLLMLYNIGKHEAVTVVTANGAKLNNTHGDCNILYRLPDDKQLYMYTFKNVHYFPSAQHFFILLLRQLLNDSLCIEGKADDLVIYQGNKPKLHFMARAEDNSLYYLLGFEKVEKRRDTVIIILTDLAYKHFAHPSKKVLRKFPSATIEFLVVTGKLSITSCSRCTQGKMH